VTVTDEPKRCEGCGAEMPPPGVPWRPRSWCSSTCAKRARRERERGGVYCRACRTELREPSESGHCGFCEVELWGWPEPPIAIREGGPV
jgi:hypothetical protein